MLIDFHTHSTASDGGLSPRDLVALARERQLALLAITDHDTVAGYLAVAAEQGTQPPSGLQLVAGGARPAVRQGLLWGVLTGIFIAAYTINDGFAVRYLDASPLLFDWLGIALRALFLLPFAVAGRQEVAQALREDWRPILVVAALSPLAYMLALYAMKLAPVSLVAPAREISMPKGLPYLTGFVLYFSLQAQAA